jgi:hypothetical protein
MRVIQALYWLRDLLVREGESDRVELKLAKLFNDPTVGPPLKPISINAGITVLPTWMSVFLKSLIVSVPSIAVQPLPTKRSVQNGTLLPTAWQGCVDFRRRIHTLPEATPRGHDTRPDPAQQVQVYKSPSGVSR